MGVGEGVGGWGSVGVGLRLDGDKQNARQEEERIEVGAERL